jgi:ABC-2 type transport system permease protein
MIAGKVLGIVAISLLQFATWVGFGIAAVLIGGNVLGLEWFQNPVLEWGTILKMFAIAVPSYITASALMFALGSTVAELQEGQSVGALFFMLHMLPLYAIVHLIETPNSLVATLMSVAPFTSLMAIGLRSLFTVVPLWQFLTSLLIQWTCALAALWFASKAFRLGMLLYGKRLRLSEILKRKTSPALKASAS